MSLRPQNLAVPFLAATGLLVTAIPAHAAVSPANAEAAPQGRVCINNFSPARACFVSHGDHVVVWDEKKDGLTPLVRWNTDYYRSGECEFDGRNNPTDCNYNMKEGSRITFRILLHDGSEIVESGPTRSARI
ncbi:MULTISPECIES: hypothetical protein [unclassified Actinopolyspora]|uniref:hypothetical protein n=1 Tax=unclassified Actinopolyspora TaxID=2639451 RepID=UPI0013F5FF96|nr:MULTISPECIES: hypothetical protein [unclassified Actinopolyspora]NHD18629.1 hypothetical protein [Actinopolyspora sp. BKK2]NHE78049.1 hypothetical protein [Actinopolyspora sp. BKK1]